MTLEDRMANNARTGALLLGVGIALVASAARAETADATKAAAQAALREGNAFLKQSKAAEALVKFNEAYRLFPSPKIQYNIGQAEGALPGHEAEAYGAMARFLSEAKDASAELRAAAEAQLRQLRPKVGLMTIDAAPADADVWLDEVNVGKATREVPFVLRVGMHKLALRKDGRSSELSTVTIGGGETLETRLTLRAPLAAPPVISLAPAPAREPETRAPATLVRSDTGVRTTSSSESWTKRRKVGAGLVGLGAVALVVGVVEHVRAFSLADQFKNAGCGTADLTTGANCQSLNSRFSSAQTGMVIGYAAAAGLAGTGAVFWWLSPTAASPSERVDALSSVRSGMTLNFQGRF